MQRNYLEKKSQYLEKRRIPWLESKWTLWNVAMMISFFPLPRISTCFFHQLQLRCRNWHRNTTVRLEYRSSQTHCQLKNLKATVNSAEINKATSLSFLFDNDCKNIDFCNRLVMVHCYNVTLQIYFFKATFFITSQIKIQIVFLQS